MVRGFHMLGARALALAVAGAALALAARGATAQPTVVSGDDLAAEITRLRADLNSDPQNTDLRVALAYRLAWSGELAEARHHCLTVVTQAPTYSDAHLLIARIDGWTRRYESARKRVALLLLTEPNNLDALKLASDIELWSKQPARARIATTRWLAHDDSAAPRFRAAQIASLQMHPLETRRWAQRAIDVEPTHRKAWALLKSTHILRLVSTTELEFFPIDDNATAIGETFSATLFPRAFWSVSAAYDYRLRFGTANHRGLLGVAHRLNQNLALDAFVRVGRTLVVPEFTGSIGASVRFADHYTAEFRYLGEKMPWPGQLHRAVVSLGAAMPAGFSIAARLEPGLLRYCGRNGIAQGAGLRGRFARAWFRANAQYAFGMELDRAPLPPFIDDRFGDDVCAAEGTDGIDLELRDTRAQVASLSLGAMRGRRYAIDIGYSLTLRLTGEQVHQTSVSVSVSY